MLEAHLDVTGLTEKQQVILQRLIAEFRKANETAKAWAEMDATKTEQLLRERPPSTGDDTEAVSRLRGWLLSHESLWKSASGHPCDVALMILSQYGENFGAEAD